MKRNSKLTDIEALIKAFCTEMSKGNIVAKCEHSGYPTEMRSMWAIDNRTRFGFDFTGGAVEFLTGEAYAEEENNKKQIRDAARKARNSG